MPSNKKKKKPASNPARGFATTSTASKTKPTEAGKSDVEVTTDRFDLSIEASHKSAIAASQPTSDHNTKALHELTPDELEVQLEESTLQMYIEKYGSKVKKDVSRQLSRLQTERRLLRSQAEPLDARKWLPPEIMQLIAREVESLQYGSATSESLLEPTTGARDLSEDDLLMRLWTLRRLLPLLGYSLEGTNLALRHLLTVNAQSGPKSLSAGKDTIWGLEECFSWLAFASNAENLPKFDAPKHQGSSTRTRKSKHNVALTNAGSSTEINTSSDSGFSTPPDPESCLHNGRPTDDDTSSPSASDFDSDLDPDDLVKKYLRLKRRLYELNPEDFDPKGKKPRRTNPVTLQANNNRGNRTQRTINRLTANLKKIESDILFDEREADKKWADVQLEISKEAADRKRLGIRNGTDPKQQPIPEKLTDGETMREEPQDEDTTGMLGELFASLPDTGEDGMNTVDAQGKIVNIRDFGKWTGMSPRRVFEEACRLRDPSARIHYKLISEATFSKRHSLAVDWSVDQDPLVFISLDSVACETSPYSFEVQMDSIACPDATQSEAYISTIALFLIFASTVEDKVYLRLPAVWRAIWEEISVLKKEDEDAKDRALLRDLQRLAGEGDYKIGQLADFSDPSVESKSSKKHVSESMPRSPHESPSTSPEAMQNLWLAQVQRASYQHMLSGRMSLPIFNFKEDLLLAIDSRQVVIVCGETGCGKSTQVPAYILEHGLSSGRHCRIYCTEPRRISAISLARRVSEELGEKKGDVGTARSLVGYAIRLESRMTERTRLIYATTGIVMRMLEGSDQLAGITHLVLDEIHERSIDSDFLLIVLRKLLSHRTDLKVVLMSATVDAQRFSTYLDQAPILNVPGRTFPVETKYLEDAIQETRFNPTASNGDKYGDEDEDDLDRTIDASAKTSLSADLLKNYNPETCNNLLKFDEFRLNYDLILKLLLTIATSEIYVSYSKAILIFLPGIAEIRKLNGLLAGHAAFRDGWYVHALHSTIATEEQEKAFLVPPHGTRKLVLATNIAETGITIPDVTCVIDTGKHKEMRFDERRQLSRLIEVFISRANAKQRRGRAGRVQKGLCFHLFTRNRHDNILLEEQTPEMLRLSLQDLVLRVKICKLGRIEQTLSEALDPPSSKNIRRAIDALVDVKALTALEELTALGRQLARLPLDVFLGKLILLGTIFGCLDAMITIAATLSSRSPFSAPMGAKSQMDVARMSYMKGDSDLLTVYNAYCAWRRIGSANGMSEHLFCRKNFLSQQTLSSIEDLKVQLTTSLVESGFIKLDQMEMAALNRVRFHSKKRNFVELPSTYNKNNENHLILNTVIAWSLYPKLLRREGKGWRNVANNQAISLHPASVIKGTDNHPSWLSFYHIMQSSNKFYNAHETSPVEGFAVALACGEAEFKMHSGVIVIDGNRIRFSLDDWRIIAAIKTLRTQIRQIMTQSFRCPGSAVSQQQQKWLSIWENMFTVSQKAKA